MIIKDCSQFPECSVLRQICEGSTNVPAHKVNAYRKRWGLPPLDGLPVQDEKIYTRFKDRPKSSRPTIIRRSSSINAGMPQVELGDMVANTLKTFGITPDRVSKWIGKPCGCKKRQEKLNKLSRWAKSVFSGGKEDAVSQLDDMINE